MLKNENIICISSIDWDFVWQGHQEIMVTFAKNGNRVLFIENTGVRSPRIGDISRIRSRIRNWFKGIKGIREQEKNIYVFSPLILPFPYSRFFRWINKYLILSVLRRWMKIMNFTDLVIWTFLPTGFAVDLIESLNKKLVVYYCIADFEKLVKNPSKIRKSENSLLKKCDLVFVQGEELKRRCEKYNNNVSIFPFGVNIDRFDGLNVSKEKPADIRHIKNKILGYVGGVHKHIDFKLVKFLAMQNPEWTLLFIGPIQTDISEVKRIPNIVFLEKKEHQELANYINSFDVCLIPYLLSEYTETVYPTKMNEYLALGKAVVATSLPEVVRFNNNYKDAVHVVKTKEEFCECIKNLLRSDNSLSKERYIAIARENNWGSRIEKMSGLIASKIEENKIRIETDWKENLLDFYKTVRRKIFVAIAICSVFYLILFKSYFLWFLASPLRIDESPKKADVIVVFGGGVGETGNPGKSTIERARYAAELYKKGYADKVIFSSGYTYAYNDAENMKLFAISAGVDEGSIILEQKANSAYENTLFTKEILDKNGWDEILLISSPYNMRRLELVFNKLTSGIKVIYTPVKHSQFYDRSNGVKLEQIKAIAHEYFGMLYYWFRGYV